MSTQLPEDVDARLWIRTTGCPEQDYIFGNPHTFPGRMEAYCPHQRRDFSVSKNEVTDASPEARLWIDGFLRGNQPKPPEEEGLLPVWRSLVEIFHRTGVWEQAQ